MKKPKSTISITVSGNQSYFFSDFILKGIGEARVSATSYSEEKDQTLAIITTTRMSETRFNNVVCRVLTKNLTDQGVIPISIEYLDED